MYNKIITSKALLKTFSLNFIKKINLFILIGHNGFFLLRLPKMYLLKYISNNSFSLIFLNNYHYQTFIKLFNVYYNRLFTYYYFRLILRGRGYRIKRICKKLYRFYFIKVNYIYFHVPPSVLVKIKKKRLFFISTSLFILRNLITEMLLIKAITAYRKRGFLYKRQLILKKRGKKKIQ